MSYEQYLHLYKSYNYKFIKIFLIENMYITIDNINISRKRSCLENIFDILYIFIKKLINNS